MECDAVKVEQRLDTVGKIELYFLAVRVWEAGEAFPK